jgi:hypothetical protein
MLMLSLVVAVTAAAEPSGSFLADRPLRLLLTEAQEHSDAPPSAAVALEQRIAALQAQIRGTDVHFPTGYLVMAYLGYGLLPFTLIGPVTLIASAFVGSQFPALVLVGAVLTGVGVVGVTLLIIGLVEGGRIERESRRHRDALVEERIRLEAELKALHEQQRGQRIQSVPLFAVAF